MRVPGCTDDDEYDTFLNKAARVLYPGKDISKKRLSLVIAQGRVPNVNLDDGPPWNLGDHLAESGGKKRRNKLVFGLHVYEGDDDDDNNNEVSG